MDRRKLSPVPPFSSPLLPPSHLVSQLSHNNNKRGKQTSRYLKEKKNSIFYKKALIQNKYGNDSSRAPLSLLAQRANELGLCQDTWLQLICLALYTPENTFTYIISIDPRKNFVLRSVFLSYVHCSGHRKAYQIKDT